VTLNNVDDSQLLAEALHKLKGRTTVETMITGGGYGGEATYAALHEQSVNLIETAIRALQPNQDKFHSADFDLGTDKQSNPATLACLHGQTVSVGPARVNPWEARFDPVICAACPFHQRERCRAKPQQRDPRYLLAFTTQEVLSAKRRREYLAHKSDGQGLRSAV
jgi:hypothetical protein